MEVLWGELVKRKCGQIKVGECYPDLDEGIRSWQILIIIVMPIIFRQLLTTYRSTYGFNTKLIAYG